MLPWRKRDKTGGADAAQAGGQVKRKLVSAVQEAVAELQYELREEQARPVTSTELSGRLVAVLEAVFLHGLKETFLGRLSARLQDAASPRMPEPSFWTFCLVFSHRAVIRQVEGLAQVASEVGRCRAWLRAALNDGLMASYISTMAGDSVSLSVHYERWAFLRDGEMRDLLLTYLAGVEVFTFALSTNVSLLNRWQAGPLVLAGLWAPPATSMVEGATDALAALAEEAAVPTFTRTLAQPIRDSSILRRGLMNEDEALRVILASTPVMLSPPPPSTLATLTLGAMEVGGQSPPARRSPSPGPPATLSPPARGASRSPSPEPEAAVRSVTVSPTLHWDSTNSCLLAREQAAGASLAQELGEEQAGGGAEEPEGSDTCDEAVYSNDPLYEGDPPPPSTSEKLKEETEVNKEGLKDKEMKEVEYEEELKDEASEEVTEILKVENEVEEPCPEPRSRSSSRSSTSSCRCSSAGPDPSCRHCSPPQLPQLLASPAGRPADLISQQTRRQRRLGELQLGFPQPPALRVPRLSLAQNVSLTAALDVVTQEAGLEEQDWRCHDCGKAIGAIFGPWHVCGYTSRYYCSDCHSGQLAAIPARLLYNWDAVPRPVARSSAAFLAAIATKPIVDLATFNPALARVAPAVEAAGRLRKQLTYLVAYLTACTRAQAEGVKVALAESVWPRDYLYTGTDVYSLADLEQLHRGELVAALEAAVALASRHVTACAVCRGRGFICEVCNDRRPVYPYHLETTSQCTDCHTVFHAACAATLDACPKCERFAARDLNMHVAASKLAREVREAVT